MASDVCLVVSDIDDTLIPRGTHGLPRRTAVAIERFVALGRHFAPITGRSRDDALKMFGGCAAGCATGAFVNGQVVYVDGRLVRSELLPSARLQEVADYLDRCTPAANILLYRGASIHALTKKPWRLNDYPSQENGRRDGCIQAIEEPWVEKANIQCACDPQEVPALAARLSRQFEDLDFVQPGDVSEIDVAPKGWSKARGVQVLAQALGVDLAQIVAVGDSDNDVALLEYVPNSYAVASGTATARRAAAHQLPSVDQEPVAQVLEAILAGETQPFCS